jgi:hypothetical protein
MPARLESGLRLQLLEQCHYSGLEQRHILLHGVPHDVQVYGEVPMDENIAHPDNLVSRNVRRHTAHLIRHMARRLANNL